jgi:hypothetical protein
LEIDDWLGVAKTLAHDNKLGLLFVDDAHLHIYELNELIDALVSDNLSSLKVIVVSSRNNWSPRAKTPNFFKTGKEFRLSRLDSDEINRLITLVDNKTEIRQLVEDTFTGFSRDEKRRRLVERCEADMFVCMKNIFASDSFDDIILREFADLPAPCQEIYRYVAALENAGVRVHRQLIIRLLHVAMGQIMRHYPAVLRVDRGCTFPDNGGAHTPRTGSEKRQNALESGCLKSWLAGPSQPNMSSWRTGLLVRSSGLPDPFDRQAARRQRTKQGSLVSHLLKPCRPIRAFQDDHLTIMDRRDIRAGFRG